MKVLIVASECSPVVKVGGLGDVVGSLPKALKKIGIDVRVVIPAYKDILHTRCEPQAQHHIGCGGGSREFVIHYAGQPQKVTLHQTVLPDTDIPLYLIENEKYISSGGVYLDPSAFASSQEEIERFAFFSKAVVSAFVVRDDIFFPDIVHCNDWHTGMIPQLIKAEARYIELKRPATVLTIHNLANQGISEKALLSRLNMPSVFESDFVKWDLMDNNLDFILQGILGSDVVNTVSQTYAQEIKTQQFGEGLSEVIKAREGRVFGILNGIDYTVFNPETDNFLKVKYPLESANFVIKAKNENKKMLQEELSLDSIDAPLIGLVSRLTNQKGIDLIITSLDKLLAVGFQVVLMGTGDKAIEEMILDKVNDKKYRGNCAGIIKFDEGIARRIYASSDIFIIPSRFEPCGLTQMVAMRYGSVPVVRAVGGLKDTVEEGRTGFVFEEFTQQEFLNAIKRAKSAYSNKNVWEGIVENCMKMDFSWDESAKEYVTLYGKALTFSF